VSRAADERPVRATVTARAAGSDAEEATRILRGELGAPHPVPLPQLRELSPGTEPLARTVTHLEGLHVGLTPQGFRLTAARVGDSAEVRRLRAAHASLLSLTADVLAGAPAGPTVVGVVGPATLAAALALPSGEPVLSDPGALRDVMQSWVAGMSGLAGRTAASLPGARPVLDVREPELDAVLAGTVRSSSGFRRLRAPDRADIAGAWEGLAALAECWLPLHPLLAPSRAAAALRVAAPGSDPGAWEGIAGLVEAGRDIVLEVPPARAGERVSARAASLAEPWRRLGLPAASLGALVVDDRPGSPLSPDELRTAAISSRDLAEALDVVRHDDLGALL
jgi:hypothetical protein